MSIRRIESSYATFLEDEVLSGTQMSVLLALAYTANEERGECCFPSDPTLSRLTHFTERAVRKAREKLRARKIITWESGGKSREGGNTSNRYTFLFPHKRMPTRNERYKSMDESPRLSVTAPAASATPAAPVAAPVAVPVAAPVAAPVVAPVAPPSVTLRTAPPVKAEVTPAKAPDEYLTAGELFGLPTFQAVVKPVVARDAKPKAPLPLMVQEAMKVCRVSDDYNINTFKRVIRDKNPDSVYQEICTFRSEINAHEHDNAENLAAILTARLQKLR